MRDVLLVEDDRVVREVVARLCRCEGLRVDEAGGVEVALARLGEASYRLAMVDLMLPERSGFDLLREIGAGWPALAAVAITGYATVENALESFRLGAFDFLPKPFDEAELLGVVRRSLRQAARTNAGQPRADGNDAEWRYFLGRHSWAALDADGTATVGVAETFPFGLGAVASVELPASGDRVTQGQELAKLRGEEEVHRVWSPLSGLTIAANAELIRSPELIDRSPFGSGWLTRLVPADLDNELPALTERLAQEV